MGKESTQILLTLSIIIVRRFSTIYPKTQKEQQYSSKKSGRNNQCNKNSLVQILMVNYFNLRNSCMLTKRAWTTHIYSYNEHKTPKWGKQLDIKIHHFKDIRDQQETKGVKNLFTV